MSVDRDQIGKFTGGGLASDIEFVLAARDAPYVVQDVLPDLRPSFDPAEFTSDEPTAGSVRRWKINKWRGGEGDDMWDASKGRFNVSDGVVPRFDGRQGLQLGPLAVKTTKSTGGDMARGRLLGYGLGDLYSLGMDNTPGAYAHQWDRSNEYWTLVRTFTTSAGYRFLSLADPNDANGWLYTTVAAGGDVVRFKSTSDEVHVAPGLFANNTMVAAFGDNLYVLDGAEILSLVDLTTADTLTQKSDVGGSSTTWTYPDETNRLTTSDVGPLWVQRLDNGITRIWEYNEANDTTRLISHNDIPRFSTPTSIMYASGFIFVGYRATPVGTEAGSAWIYFHRGAQRGSIGPLRGFDISNGSSKYKLVTLAGLAGDDLMFYYDGGIWSYNFSSGGLSLVARSVLGWQPEMFSAAVYDDAVFVAVDQDVLGDGAVERVALNTYTTSANRTLDSGRFDYGWAGLDKVLLDITVIADPLPANVTVKVAYSVDGASFTTHADSWATDGETSHTFTIPISPAVVGESFEIQLLLTTTDSLATPTIREVIARAEIDELFRQYTLEISLDAEQLNRWGEQLLTDLQTLAATSGYVQFVDPYGTGVDGTAVTRVVKVKQVVAPNAGDDEVPYAQVVVRERDTI